MSTFQHPDKEELNYHAGTAVRHNQEVLSFRAHHLGVQFCDENQDVLLAALLLHVCSDPSVDISHIRCNMSTIVREIGSFMDDEIETFSFSYSELAFCETEVEEVMLFCICRSPWIEGSTSKAIYGSKQKLFNSHSCSVCNNWFHSFCLSHCNIALPKRSQDYACPYCRVPKTIPWKHFKYTNTCTSDNFLNIIHLTCLQDDSFLGKIGSSKAECVLKASLTEIIKGNIVDGKTMILDFIQAATGRKEGSVNCWGGEYSNCLVAFKNIWRVALSIQCTSAYCPNPILKSRYPVGFNLNPPALAGASFTEQLAEQFPIIGIGYGYCGEKFLATPSSDALYEVVQVQLVGMDSGVYEEKCECRGVPITKHCGFASKSAPWVIPFDIAQFTGKNLVDLNNLPHQISLYGSHFILAGYSLFIPGHFLSVVYWHGTPYVYDGMGTTPEARLKKYDDILDFLIQRKDFFTGSHAFYVISGQ